MKRIFFVEDDLSLISGLSFALEKQGYQTDIARTVLEARQLWQKKAYDCSGPPIVILVDCLKLFCF